MYAALPQSRRKLAALPKNNILQVQSKAKRCKDISDTTAQTIAICLLQEVQLGTHFLPLQSQLAAKIKRYAQCYRLHALASLQ